MSICTHKKQFWLNFYIQLNSHKKSSLVKKMVNCGKNLQKVRVSNNLVKTIEKFLTTQKVQRLGLESIKDVIEYYTRKDLEKWNKFLNWVFVDLIYNSNSWRHFSHFARSSPGEPKMKILPIVLQIGHMPVVAFLGPVRIIFWLFLRPMKKLAESVY